jgi:hypothetical protein
MLAELVRGGGRINRDDLFPAVGPDSGALLKTPSGDEATDILELGISYGYF